MPLLYVVERSVRAKLSDGLAAHGSGHEQQRDFLNCLMEELHCLRPLPARGGVLCNDYIIRLVAELLRTLGQSQDQIGADYELRSLELLDAVVYDICIAVNEKDTERAPPVSDSALRTETPLS
jgi:hypothetical protein